jgi:hypothetical protein
VGTTAMGRNATAMSRIMRHGLQQTRRRGWRGAARMNFLPVGASPTTLRGRQGQARFCVSGRTEESDTEAYKATNQSVDGSTGRSPWDDRAHNREGWCNLSGLACLLRCLDEVSNDAPATASRE